MSSSFCSWEISQIMVEKFKRNREKFLVFFFFFVGVSVEAELRLPERVLVVLLMPPEVLRCFERGPVSTVAALAAARPGRHAATLRFHPGSQLRALLPSRVHHAGPRASPMLLLPPPAASGTEHRLGSASHLKLPEAQRLRGFRRPRGGSASRRGHGL